MQFADPMRYIASIRAACAEFGACSIVPPPGWRHESPSDPVPPDDLSFAPRLMPLHRLQEACAFPMAEETSVSAFRAEAAARKTAYYTKHAIVPGAPDEEERLERSFWRSVRTDLEPLVVPYGADLDSTTHWTGFGKDEGGWWNLNRCSRAPGSLLDASLKVAGISLPWLYLGSLFAAFCW